MVKLKLPVDPKVVFLLRTGKSTSFLVLLSLPRNVTKTFVRNSNPQIFDLYSGLPIMSESV